MKSLHLALVAGLLLGFLCPLAAQSNAQKSIMVKAVKHNGKVYLRWVPMDYSLWKLGNTQGYIVNRQQIASNGTQLSNDDRLMSRYAFPQSFLPLPEAAWEPLALTNDMAGVAAGAIYSEVFEAAPTGDLFYQKATEGQKNEDRFGFGMFAADQDFEVAKNMGLGIDDMQAFSSDSLGTFFLPPLASPPTANGGVSDQVKTQPSRYHKVSESAGEKCRLF